MAGSLDYRFDLQRNGKVMTACTGALSRTRSRTMRRSIDRSVPRERRRVHGHGHDGEVPVEVRGGAACRACCAVQLMASLGFYLLLAAFVSGACAAAISVAGARRRSQRLIESGTGAFYLTMAIMLAASSVIVHAFVTGNYAIKCVDRYSNTAQSLAYKLTSYWGGLDGSIMFWVTLLSIFGCVAVYVNRERHRELIPYVVAVISVVEVFFLFLMIVHNNPFETYITETKTDGRGLSPLLQNFYMVIHPPTMCLSSSWAARFRSPSAWPHCSVVIWTTRGCARFAGGR